jgi:hypothetical protein
MCPKASWLAPVALGVLVGGVGCALPKVALGASVSLGSTRATGATGGRSSVRSALWIALEYAATSGKEAEPPPERRQPLDEPAPCALEATCAWERAATAEATRTQLSIDSEGEPLP